MGSHTQVNATNSTEPKVSIGMPVYNGEKYVGAAIDSILNQTFDDFELLVADNCSTDATPDIVNAAAERDPRVRLHRNDTNLGANPNYNLLVPKTTGQYFKWAACDDLLTPTYLEKTVALLDDEPDVVLAHGKPQLIDRTGAPLTETADGFVDSDGYLEGTPEGDRFFAGIADRDPAKRIRAVMIDSGYACHIFGLIRRAPLAETTLMGRIYGTDKVLLAQLALRGRFGTVDEQLFQRRCHPDTSTRVTDSSVKQSWSTGQGRQGWYPTNMLLGYRNAVAAAPLSPQERRRCHLEVARKCAQPGKWRQLLLPGPWNYLGIDRKSATKD